MHNYNFCIVTHYTNNNQRFLQTAVSTGLSKIKCQNSDCKICYPLLPSRKYGIYTTSTKILFFNPLEVYDGIPK